MSKSIVFPFKVADEEVFPPVIIIDERDSNRNTPTIYLPDYIDVQNIYVFQWMKDNAWDAYEAKEQGLKQELVEDGATTYTALTNSYQLARYGLQVVRIYAKPEDNITLEAMTPVTNKGSWGVNRYSLLRQIGTKKFLKTYIFPGNTGDYDPFVKVGEKENGDDIFEFSPIRKISIEKDTVKETLTFNGTKTERIKYWYSNGKNLNVIKTSLFFNREGKQIDPPVNQDKPLLPECNLTVETEEPELLLPPNFTDTETQKPPSSYFQTTEEAWGSITVKYEVEYHRFFVLYDIEDIKREYDISVSVERVGFVTLDKGGILIEYGMLPDNEVIGTDRTETVDENGNSVTYNLQIIKQLSFKPLSLEPIGLFASSKNGISTSSFTPQVDLCDFIYEEMPKLNLFQRRRRVLYSSGTTIDHIEDITYLDVFGRVSTEKMDTKTDLGI